MQLASSARIPDGFMAAMRLGGEKPHQGLPGRNPALYQGPTVCNSTTALGLRGQAELNRVGSCSTGKERDSESGNDYFGARYYASSMGRFMSPDWSAKEEPVPYAKLDDPQSLNLYAYVRNNPLGAVDSDGHVVVEKATTYVPYPVSGATASEALDQANSHFTGPDGQGYAGMTTPSLSVSWSSEPSGTLANGSATVTQTITSDTVTMGNTVQLPEWTGSAQASPAERDAFNTAVGQLKDHENQHVSDNRAAANALDKSLPGTKATATASTVQAASRAAGAKVQTKVDAKVAGATADITNRAATLDKNTNHGVKLQ
jgi:RHS repeat-associated protein